LNPRVLLSAAVVAALNSGGVYASCTELDVADAEGLRVSHAFDLVSLCLPDLSEAKNKYTWVSSDNLKVDLVSHPDFEDRERYIFVTVKPVPSTFHESRAGRIEFIAFSKHGGGEGELKHYSINVRFPPVSTDFDAQEIYTSETPSASGACIAQADIRVSEDESQSEQGNSLIQADVASEQPSLWEPPVVDSRVELGSSNGPSLWAPGRDAGQSPDLWSPAVVSRAQMITQLFESSSRAPVDVTTPALWKPGQQSPRQDTQVDIPRALWQP
jgi:hypothetical protein